MTCTGWCLPRRRPILLLDAAQERAKHEAFLRRRRLKAERELRRLDGEIAMLHIAEMRLLGARP